MKLKRLTGADTSAAVVDFINWQVVADRLRAVQKG